MTEQEQRLQVIAWLAVAAERKTRVPAHLTVAQWAAESHWGKKPVGKWNVFGIKRAKRHKHWLTRATSEVIGGRRVTRTLDFADYLTLEDAVADYTWLISHGAPYRQVWQAFLRDNKFQPLVMGVAKVYATDPDYGVLVWRIANQANVNAAIVEARRA